MKTLVVAAAILSALCAEAAFTMSGAGANGMMKTSDSQVQSFKLSFAPRAKSAPKLDGKLDDACWQGVDPINDYGPCTIGQSPRRSIPRTEVRLTWDDKYLYVAAQCWEDTPENMASFRHIVNDGKRAFFCRDCIEMHIDGNNDEHTTFQCWLLANHEKFIHWNWDRGWGILTDHDYGLNADWDIAHSIGEDSWTVEARYALAHFELKPQVGYIFGLEPARFRYNKAIYDKVDGSEMAKNQGQWLAWGAQGKNHHNADGYGKVIFVDKKPATVAEGLKLAYPDLDKRTILVQTGSEYAVFDHGKVSTLTYGEKAKALVEETGRLAARYEAFLGEVSNVVWKASANAVKGTLKEVAAYRKLAEEVAARQEFDIGFIGELEKKCGKWDGQLDKDYWALVRDAMLVEGRTRVPVKLNPAPNAPELNTEFADCTFRPEERTHDIVEWAKPLAGGKKKVFITVNSQGGIDAWQLAKRMDVDAAIFQSTGQGGAVGVSSDYYNEGHWFVAAKRQELERALKEKGPFDAFVFIGTGVRTWPEELQCWLLERVLEGAKVIEKNGAGNPVFAKLVTGEDLSAGSPKGMTRLAADPAKGAFGAKLIPVSLGTDPLKTAVFGKGAYGRVSTDAVSGWCHGGKGSPAWPTKPDNEFQDEYGFAYLVRNVMQVLGLRDGRRAVDVGDGLHTVAAGEEATVPLRTAGADAWSGEIGWRVRDLVGNVVQEDVAAFTVPAGTNHVSLALKPLAAGEYYVDATLYAPGRKVIDFASGRVVAANEGRFVKCGCSPNCRELLAAPAITEFKLAARTLNGADEPVKATVTVAPAAADLMVRAEIRDVRNRVIVRKDFPVDPATGRVSLELRNVPEYDWTLANLDVSLWTKTRRLDARTEEFYRHRGDVADYQVFTSSPAPGGRFGKMRLAYDMNSGIDLYQKDYSPNYLWYGGDGVLRDRIPGGAPDKGGSLSNPWWLNHLKGRYGRHAQSLKQVNGRFISLGDDSGEPNEFPRSVPDWVPCWVAQQLEKCRKAAEQFEREGNKRPMFAATTKWWGDHGKPKSGTDSLSNYWGFEAPLKKFAEEWVKDLRTPQDLKEIVGCLSEVYGRIEVFNRAANVKVASWKDITPELLRDAKWDPSPEYVRFLFWLKDRYGKDIAKLNAAWHSDVKDFAEIPRALIDEKQAEGVYTPVIDMQTFLEDAFVNQAKAIAQGIHGVDPTIGLGFGASTLGNTFTESCKWLDSVCPYAGSFDIEKMRGQKHKFIGECIGVYGGRNVPVPMRRKQVWHGLLTGCNFSWFWDACYNYGDGTVDARKYGAMFASYREVKRGPAAMLLRSRRDNYGVKLMVSRDAGHFGPFLKDMSTHGQALGGFGSLVESLGLQHDSVTGEQVARGDILKDGTKVLVLPYLQAVRKREAEVIRDFVRKGGTVIADARVGLFDEKGVRYAKPALDDVFGVTTGPVAKPALCDVKVKVNGEGEGEGEGATLAGALVDTSVRATTAKPWGKAADGSVAFLVNDFGKGKAVLLNFNLAVIPFLDGRGELGGVRDALEQIVALAGLKPMAVMKNAKGETVTGTEFTRYEREGAVYLGVEKTGRACETFPMEAYVQLDRKYWVYDVRAGKKVGFTDRIPMTLEGLDIALYALLPAEAKAIELDVPDTVAPGTSLKTSAKLKVTSPSPLTFTSVFRFELIPADGNSPEEFMAYPWRIRDAKGGVTSTAWAIGCDEKPGTEFTVIVTDVATGVSASKVVVVR